jgi:hypothetical protein
MSIEDAREMEGMPPIDQAKMAITYALQRIKDERQIGYHMGVGTQAFALLTEAAASLWGTDLEKVRYDFAPRSERKADTELVREIRSAWDDYKIGMRRAADDDCGRKMAKGLLIERLDSIFAGEVRS